MGDGSEAAGAVAPIACAGSGGGGVCGCGGCNGAARKKSCSCEELASSARRVRKASTRGRTAETDERDRDMNLRAVDRDIMQKS